MKGTLENELDFLKEAKNSEECAKDLENFKYLYVPKLFRNLSSHRVLTTEFIDGIKVTEGMSDQFNFNVVGSSSEVRLSSWDNFYDIKKV